LLVIVWNHLRCTDPWTSSNISLQLHTFRDRTL